ncbi:MAG: hypothetical protein JEY91_14745 [Spirochaetaceae bacterium]|nr:hypothetical protein [Spirochaetaceae bacterium]
MEKKYLLKKSIIILFCSLVLLSLVGCDYWGKYGDPRVETPTQTVDLVWGEFGETDVADQNRSDTVVTLEDTDERVWATAGRAQSIYEVSGEVSTDSYFNEGNSADNSLRFISSGADWGGVYIAFSSTENGEGIEVNMENFAAIKFAVKGSIGGLYIALSDVNNAGPGTFDLMADYTPVDEGGWSVYTVPFADLTNLDKTKFCNLAFWAHNPGSDTYAGDILIDVQFVLTADY